MARSRESPTRSNPNRTRSQHVLRKTCQSASNRLLITRVFAGTALIKTSRRAPQKGTRRLKILYCPDSAARSPGPRQALAQPTSFARTDHAAHPSGPRHPLVRTMPPARAASGVQRLQRHVRIERVRAPAHLRGKREIRLEPYPIEPARRLGLPHGTARLFAVRAVAEPALAR